MKDPRNVVLVSQPPPLSGQPGGSYQEKKVGETAHWQEGLGSVSLRDTPRGTFVHMEGGIQKGGIP